jgi:uncharacterized protein YwqG
MSEEDDDKIGELFEKIKNLSKTEYYQITINPNIVPEIYDSKLGGLPYWTPDLQYPLNSEGKKLILLAQINFDKENVDSPLRKQGILQFFITDDDLMGIDFDDQTKQNNFRVIYHEKVDYNITKDSIKHYNIPNCIEKDVQCFPISKEYKISLTKNIDYISTHDFHFDEIFAKAYKEVYNKALKPEDTFNKILDDEELEKLEEKLENDLPRHKMLGYSFFTQEDPRYNKEYKDYDTLLFQIDSEGEYILWGDVGVGNFFISKKSLLKKDFSKVLYNWDCS